MEKLNKELAVKEKINRFFKPIFAQKKISLKAVTPSVLGSIIGITTVFLLKEITNKIELAFDEKVLFLLFLFIFFVIFYYFLLIFTRNWEGAIVWPKFRFYLYKKYISKYTLLDNNYTESVGTGKAIAIIDKGVLSRVQLVDILLFQVSGSVSFIIFSLIFIGFINIYYLLVIMILSFFVAILTSKFQKLAKFYRVQRREVNIGITKKFVKIIMSKFEILQNGKINKEMDFIEKSLGKNYFFNRRVQVWNISTDLVAKFLIDFLKVFVILMFGIGFLGSQISFGEFVSLMSIVYILDQIFTKSINSYVNFTKIFVDIEKLRDFFDNSSEIKGYESGKNFNYKQGDIELKNISYGYSEDKLVFKNFNLKINGGKVTAFVGNSGSGKSTLIKLISGYISTNEGEVLIDNQKISELSLKNYYKNIGYLTQDPSVFDGTIMDNLTYAIDRKLKDGELDNILKQAKCEFIYDLPKGLETEIGERGVRLSGGQKQRLAIAKIFLKDPKIIFLDEPTSALDSFSEDQITKAMHNLFKGRTVIIVAHRLQTVKNADEIILFADGKIKERGKHEELIEEGGDYAKMLELQSGF